MSILNATKDDFLYVIDAFKKALLNPKILSPIALHLQKCMRTCSHG